MHAHPVHPLLLAAAITTGATAAAAQEPLLTVAVDDELGEYITGRNGRPVYVFLTDARGGDNITPILSCNARCQEDWPLVTSEGEPPVGSGLSEFLAEEISWEGKTVVVYDSNVLFYYAHEDPETPGPDGQAISTYGGWWYAVAPDGEPIKTGIVSQPTQ
jgi:predicted lipoprotein with Yx(FWY)xxD motif